MTAKLRAEASAVSTAETGALLERARRFACRSPRDHRKLDQGKLGCRPELFRSVGRAAGQGLCGRTGAADTPASQAGIRGGDRLVSVDGVPLAAAIASFWADLGTTGGGDRDGDAARVLVPDAATDRGRLWCSGARRSPRSLTLANLYSRDLGGRPHLSAVEEGNSLVLRINDSSGNRDTVAVFDQAMARARPGQAIVIDLTDTASGGNTTVARHHGLVRD